MTQPVWNTPATTIGTFPSLVPMTFQLSASAVQPALTLTYKIISGSLPPGLSMDAAGLISGTPELVIALTSSNFVVRVTDNLQNIRDRTFSISVSGSSVPTFTTPAGPILTVMDSTWVELPIQYNNPVEDNEVSIRLIQGLLPIGLEINEHGMIRGYPAPPTFNLNIASVVTPVTATNDSDQISCFSTVGFSIGRPIIFTGTVFGGVLPDIVYYVKTIIDEFTFTISTTVGGDTVPLSNAVGIMTAMLPSITTGQPTIRTFTFTLKLESLLGEDTETFSITVVNQNTPTSQGGPGYPPNTRIPAIMNTRPPSFNITKDPNFGYYVLPPDSAVTGKTYPITESGYIGQFTSDNYFAFQILGHDFDGSLLEYVFEDMPLGMTGDTTTGWITGTPVIADNSINEYLFGVAVRKVSDPAIISPFFQFTMRITNDIEGIVYWNTPSDLGTIFNGTISNKYISAYANYTNDNLIDLQYNIVSGELPPNLTLLSNGEITGIVASQPTTEIQDQGSSSTFTFTVEAFSPLYNVVRSRKTFTLIVYQEYEKPTDILYIKCTPDVSDRNILASLLNNENIIPTEYLYRPSDIYFGKAQNVTYVHAYGIYASQLPDYVAAVTTNHYWRDITLGELKTAIARDENGDILYEVVYSQVIDNLVNPEGISIDKSVYWPRFIPLNLGPWYTSSTDIYSSFVDLLDQEYYTSLTPGFARTLYPNSLENMRNKVAETLGQVFNSTLLPLWMTSQQKDGSTLGYVPAWVICHTKPGYSEIVKNNILTKWTDELGNPYRLNRINFEIDRFTVDKSITYNYDNTFNPPAWTGLPSGTPIPNPLDSKDFYVLYPRKTILPDRTQY